MVASSNGCYELEQLNDLVEKDYCWTFPNMFGPSELHWERTSTPDIPYYYKLQLFKHSIFLVSISMKRKEKRKEKKRKEKKRKEKHTHPPKNPKENSNRNTYFINSVDIA